MDCSSTATIESLPSEVLVRIFHAMPWRDRVCGAEAVCKAWRELMRTRGWADVWSFNNNKDLFFRRFAAYPYTLKRIAYEAHLLDRFGTHLRSLTLDWAMRRQDHLLTFMGKCPQLRHLSIEIYGIKPATIEHIQRAYATSLKLLRLGSDEWKVASVRALGEALRHFASLEYLQIAERGRSVDGSVRDLRLPPTDLTPNLRHIALQCSEINGTLMLGAENIYILTSYTQLRSLSISGLDPAADLSFLQHLPRLAHLRIDCVRAIPQSFVKVLPHMGGSLKALEVGGDGGVQRSVIEQLIDVIVAHVPQLEHFGLLYQYGTFTRAAYHSLSKMDQLRSLQMKHALFCTMNWLWLAEMTRLEHLELPSAPFHAILCDVMRNCKSLRFVRFPGYKPSTDEQVGLIEAAAAGASDAENVSGTNGKASASKFPLFVHVERGWKCDAENTRGSRVRFTDQDAFPSHVLQAYKYGQLSEGKPKFPG